MSKRRTDTRRAILNVAETLFQQRGYHGFSFHQVAAELGIGSAAVHYHFPGKADLGAAVVQRAREDFAWWRGQFDVRTLSGGERLERFFDLDRRYAEGRKVCPFGVVGVEYEGVPTAVREATEALLADVLDHVEDSLLAGREDGTLQFEGDAESVAHQVLAAMQGALQLSRLRGVSAFDRVHDGIRALLGYRSVDSARAGCMPERAGPGRAIL